MMKVLKFLLLYESGLGEFCLALEISSIMSIYTPVAAYTQAQYDKVFENYYLTHASLALDKRLERAVSLFIDKPYLFEALGEGSAGAYSQEPLYRTDKFDCVTLVDTVLAMALSDHFNEFKNNLLAIRYYPAQINYLNRTDWFSDLEWFPNAERLGWTKDVTSTIVDAKKNDISLIAQTNIDKPQWYKARVLNDLHLLETTDAIEAEKALVALQKLGDRFSVHPSQLSYLPLSTLFDENGNPKTFLFDQIPSACVMAVVRPNWDIRDNFKDRPLGYGTNLNVSHFSLLLQTAEGLMMFHASYNQHKVVKELLVDYLKEYIESDTVKGIHLEQILSTR